MRARWVVYKAFDPDIRRDVALRTIRRQFTDGSDFAASIATRFRKEAQAAGRLSHPGIVGVYDYGEDGQVAYIAMEFVEGQSIAHYIASQVRFTDTDIPGLMSQLLDAIDHAHGQGVWHRDIKPANVILSAGASPRSANPIDDTAWDATIVRSPRKPAPAASDRAAVRTSTSGAAGYAWDPTLLDQAQGMLAHYVGPLATILVRRAARECDTPAALYAKLAEQLTGPSARRAFLGRVTPAGQTTHSNSGNSSAGIAIAPTRQLSETLLECSQRLLAAHVGPIAKILVKKAAAQTHDRAAFVARLAEAAPHAARARLIAELERLP